MVINKIVNATQLDADLTDIADAIRAKGGTSAQLQFPSGFVDAVEAIETGGGGVTIDEVAERNFPDSITINADILDYAFAYANTKNVTIASGKKIYLRAFTYSTVETVYAPLLTAVNDADYAFSDCSKLHTIEYGAQSIGAHTFENCRSLASASFKNLATIYTNAFSNCTSLSALDLPKLTGIIRTNAFGGCSSLKTLVLRNSVVATLSNINNFANTPFASGGAGGTLYVPSALISSYQSATNWSTILGYANNQILPIEGSNYETQYADGTPIS